MRVIPFTAFAVLSVALAGTAQAQSAVKLGFIDSRAIVAEAPGAQEAQEQFDRDMARYRAELEQMGQQIQTLITQFDQQQLTLSPEAKSNRQTEIRNKQSEYQQRVQQLEQQAADRQQELVEPIMAQINQVIDEIRQEGSYAMIFDVAAGAIIAADPAMDLTQQVIDRLKTSTNGGGAGS